MVPLKPFSTQSVAIRWMEIAVYIRPQSAETSAVENTLGNQKNAIKTAEESTKYVQKDEEKLLERITANLQSMKSGETIVL